jgi:hypothetical protein
MRALADAVGDGPLADLVLDARGVLRARLLLSLLAVTCRWLAVRVVGSIALDRHDAFSGAPEQALLVLGDLRQRRCELGFRDAARSALGLQLERELVGGDAPSALPIEHAWSKLKALLRKAGARTVRKLSRALRGALLAITSSHAHGWFSHCGFRVPCQ